MCLSRGALCLAKIEDSSTDKQEEGTEIEGQIVIFAMGFRHKHATL